MDGYWTNNSLIYLIGLVLFPRFSLLFCNVSGNIIFWLGWLFLPRITVAFLATIYYWNSNPFLVILSWLFAMGGESAEKSYGYKLRNKSFRHTKETEYEIIE